MEGSTTAEEREEELAAISAIFPEIQIDTENPYKASLEVPVCLASPLLVSFPSTSDGAPPRAPPTPPTTLLEQDAALETQSLSYLPPLRLDINLPAGYPTDEPPHFDLQCSVKWLPQDTLDELKKEGPKLWEEYGRSQVVYGYIDFLQQAAERAFGLSENEGSAVSFSPDLQVALLDFNAKAKKEKFNQETFDCGVCLDPKKGSACYQMARCKHVFCIGCLKDFYNNAILEGDVSTVRCLDPDCGKEPGARRSRKKLRTLTPSELLQIPLEHAAVKRYVDLKRKKKLEADQTTVFCPREWCQGPAKSSKYPKPTSFDDYVDSGSEDEGPPPPEPEKPTETQKIERLAICEDCQLAFCRQCLAGWHGEFVRCWPRTKQELSEEEQATYNYIRKHTSPCPTCSSAVQKTHGCNHMTCFNCRSHFCYLCSSWLSPDNPYQHFNKPGTPCYQLLWELEEGDDGHGGQFQGARGWEVEIPEDIIAEDAAAILPEVAVAPPAQNAAAARDPPVARADAADLLYPVNRLNIRDEAPPRAANARAARPGLQEPRRGLALQRFLQMAQNDEEEDWDSDELDDEDDEFANLR